MKQGSKRIIITRSNINNKGTLNIITYPKNNLNESESTKFNNEREKKIININPNYKKITLNISKKKENNRNNIKYKMLIKKIANILKKRIKFPKCKIFKFYLKYRQSVIKIANKLKKTAKHINFWDKYLANITEKEINQIQEIASTACKIIEAGGQKKVNKKKLSSSNKKSRKNIKVNVSILERNNEKELHNKNDNDNNKYEINKHLDFLKNLNENNDTYFIKEFSSFLENNNIKICPESKLPLFMNDNNKLLLSQKEFWIKYIIFISKKYKNDLTMYNYIFFIEQFCIWNYNSIANDEFNKEIKKQISLVFNEEIVNKFFISNKIKDLDGLFEKYKNIHINNTKYREIKLDGEDNKDKICDCSTCANKGFIDKIINYNKTNNEISFAKNNNLSYLNENVIKFDKIKIKKDEHNEISILSKKDEENENIFKYLRKIEMGKNEDKKEEKVKKRKSSNYKKKRKNKKKDKIKEIFDLLSIDGDDDSHFSEDSYDSFQNSTKRRTKSTKIKNKDN